MILQKCNYCVIYKFTVRTFISVPYRTQAWVYTWSIAPVHFWPVPTEVAALKVHLRGPWHSRLSNVVGLNLLVTCCLRRLVGWSPFFNHYSMYDNRQVDVEVFFVIAQRRRESFLTLLTRTSPWSLYQTTVWSPCNSRTSYSRLPKLNGWGRRWDAVLDTSYRERGPCLLPSEIFLPDITVSCPLRLFCASRSHKYTLTHTRTHTRTHTHTKSAWTNLWLFRYRPFPDAIQGCNPTACCSLTATGWMCKCKGLWARLSQ
jgi:hypothetical protein